MRVPSFITLSLGVIPTAVWAGCYTSGEQAWNKDHTYDVLGVVCNVLAGDYAFNEDHSVCYMGTGADSSHHWDFEIARVSGATSGGAKLTLSKDDCIAGLKAEVHGCGRGGKSTGNDWFFRSDPNAGDCGTIDVDNNKFPVHGGFK